MVILDCAQTKKLEEEIVARGMPHLKLMENAGRAVARFIRDKFGVNGKTVAVVCGKGFNGGDGFVIAHKLFEHGARVRILLVGGQPAHEDSVTLLERCHQDDILTICADSSSADSLVVIKDAISSADIIVDAVYGTGFHGEISDNIAQIFSQMNSSTGQIIAVDIPSGVCADTGAAAENCVRADYTVTFTSIKPGHVVYPGAGLCGMVFTAPIGIEPGDISALAPACSAIDYSSVRKCFKPRLPNSHKGTYGTLLAICGSYGMSGAAVFAARAAAHAGVGKVCLALPDSIYPIVAAHINDPVFLPLEEEGRGRHELTAAAHLTLLEVLDKCSACLFGCGCGQTDDSREILCELIEKCTVPLVLDADALHLLAQDISLLERAKCPIILTPHPGEMAHLIGRDSAYVQANRLEVARDFAKQHNVILVLKGANTIIAEPNGQICVNLTGNSGMSKGGSGDVLAGLIASFCAQGLVACDSAKCGVYIHGAAGDLAAKKYSMHSMSPNDIIMEFSTIFLELES